MQEREQNTHTELLSFHLQIKGNIKCMLYNVQPSIACSHVHTFHTDTICWIETGLELAQCKHFMTRSAIQMNGKMQQ